MKSTVATGQPGSDVWYQSDRLLVTYAAVRDDQARIVGAIVIGRPLNDVLSRVSESTTGRALVIAVPKADGFQVVAHSALQASSLDDSVGKGAKEMLKNAPSPTSRRTSFAMVTCWWRRRRCRRSKRGRTRSSWAPRRPRSSKTSTGLALMPIFGAVALGLLLVVLGGWLLGNYISRPINQLEEGLLAILNGQHDKRFELDHAELGGLAFRIDQLLNQLMGVEEDTTDAEGRVSGRPNAANSTEALSVDDRRMQQRPGRKRSTPTPSPGSRKSRRPSITRAFSGST